MRACRPVFVPRGFSRTGGRSAVHFASFPTAEQSAVLVQIGRPCTLQAARGDVMHALAAAGCATGEPFERLLQAALRGCASAPLGVGVICADSIFEGVG